MEYTMVMLEGQNGPLAIAESFDDLAGKLQGNEDGMVELVDAVTGARWCIRASLIFMFRTSFESESQEIRGMKAQRSGITIPSAQGITIPGGQ